MNLIKSIFCKHKELRFVRYLHGDAINRANGRRYEYICIRCGWPVFLFAPYNCDGCSHLYYRNDGGAECEMTESQTRSCLQNHRILWDEKSVD